MTSKCNKLIHGLWIGDTLSALELLCIKSFQNMGHEFHLWTYGQVKNIPSYCINDDANEIIPSDQIFKYDFSNKFGHGKGSYAGFSDIFRYRLLYLKGGWWTDMDVTCLAPLDFETPYVFRLNGKKGIVGNLMKCPTGSDLMDYCYKRAIAEVTATNKDWLLPIQILNEGITQFKLIEFSKTFTNEDSWPLISKMFFTKSLPSSKWLGIHWMNEEWRRFNLDKNKCISNTNLNKLYQSNGISVELYTVQEIKILSQILSKWNYRWLFIKAKWKWKFKNR